MLRVTQEYEAIKNTIQNYIDGANGDMELLKIAYHEDATINSQPIQNLFASVLHNGKTNAVGRIDSIDITGNVASAKVIIENWHGNNYVEYLHFLKYRNTWKIVSKVFDVYKD